MTLFVEDPLNVFCPVRKVRIFMALFLEDPFYLSRHENDKPYDIVSGRSILCSLPIMKVRIIVFACRNPGMHHQ
jgi:hypothetical protein